MPFSSRLWLWGCWFAKLGWYASFWQSLGGMALTDRLGLWWHCLAVLCLHVFDWLRPLTSRAWLPYYLFSGRAWLVCRSLADLGRCAMLLTGIPWMSCHWLALWHAMHWQTLVDMPVSSRPWFRSQWFADLDWCVMLLAGMPLASIPLAGRPSLACHGLADLSWHVIFQQILVMKPMIGRAWFPTDPTIFQLLFLTFPQLFFLLPTIVQLFPTIFSTTIPNYSQTIFSTNYYQLLFIHLLAS